eukprot:ANDGO_06716.mRNA.1 Coactosin
MSLTLNSAAGAAVTDVRDPNGNHDWLLVQYSPASKTELSLLSSGTGGIPNLKSALVDNCVQYGLIRVTTGDAQTRQTRFVFVVYSGDNVRPMERAKISVHQGAVRELLGSVASADVRASNPEEIDEVDIAERLKKVRGANYDNTVFAGTSQSSPAASSPKPAQPSPQPKSEATQKPAPTPAPAPAPVPAPVSKPATAEPEPESSNDIVEKTAQLDVNSADGQSDTAPVNHDAGDDSAAVEHKSEDETVVA